MKSTGVIFLLFILFAQLQAAEDIKELKLKNWKPRSMLKTKVTKIEKPAFPVIDIHNHLRRVRNVEALIREMDRSGVDAVVNLDGFGGEFLRRELDRFDNAYPGRFFTFTLIDFRGIDDPGWSAREVKRIEADFKAGAKGLKIHKSLGLRVRYRATGKLVTVDDPKLDPIWELCGRYNRPVMIHTSDPAAFFTPLDRENERWHELNEHPNWLFFGEDYPSRAELLIQRNRVIERHPKTVFIGAHMANNPENLEEVGRWLDLYPNLYVDIDARISELGRQPYTARRFFLKYQDRILFGTDTIPNREMYSTYYRFMESDDEYWDCAPSHHPQGFWMIYGIFLPPDVLRKVYRTNALKFLQINP